jgi:hypothetical protein
MEPCPQTAEARASRSRARAAAAQKAKLAGDVWNPYHSVENAECDDTEDLNYPIENGDDSNDYYYQVRQRLQALKAAGAAGRRSRASASITLADKTTAEKGAIIGGAVLGIAVIAFGGYMLYKRMMHHKA